MSGDRLIPDLGGGPPEEEAPERPKPPAPWPPPREEPPPFLPAQQETPQAPPPDPPEEPTPYAARFQLILGALLGIAAVAVVAALVLGTGPAAPGDKDFSRWQPDSRDRTDGPQEIANHVAPTYRLSTGQQLVAITGGKLEVADLPVRLALADPRAGKISVLNGDGVLYTLCGLGPKCSIATGKPSPERHLLLRREALELALYTFRYVKGTDYVVALLPPRKGEEPTQAMFFRKDDLSEQLDRPLTATVPFPPPTTESLNPLEVSNVQRLTGRRLFQFKFEQGQDATVFLVLQPFAAG